MKRFKFAEWHCPTEILQDNSKNFQIREFRFYREQGDPMCP